MPVQEVEELFCRKSKFHAFEKVQELLYKNLKIRLKSQFKIHCKCYGHSNILGEDTQHILGEEGGWGQFLRYL